MTIRRVIVITLLLLLGIQPAIAGVDTHNENDDHSQSSLMDTSLADLSDNKSDLDSADTNDAEAGCDHCGGCCSCHSNANAVQSIQSIIVSAIPMIIPSTSVGSVAQVAKSLYRPPIA